MHCSNECDKEQTIKTSNKNGSSFLVLNQDKNKRSSDDDDYKNESGVPSYEVMHVLRKEEEETESDQSKEDSDIEGNSDDDKKL